METNNSKDSSKSEPKVRWSAWLCRMGWHRWRYVGIGSIIEVTPVSVCERCGIGRELHWSGAEFRYTKQQMDESMRHNDQAQRLAVNNPKS